MRDAPKLEVRELTVHYETPRGVLVALDRVSLVAPEGERIVVLGPSGCGKSTLLKAVGGFVKPSCGEIRVAGRLVTGPGPDRMMMFQEFDQLLPWKTVLQNVTYAIEVTGRFARGEAGERALEFLDAVGLYEFRDFYPHTLSGGMKQRAAMARALAVGPDVLLMDEPFGSLDAQSREALQLELLRVWEKTRTTIVFVTHSIDEAVLLGQQILIMTESPGRMKQIMDNSVGSADEGRTPEFWDVCREIRGLLQVPTMGA
ncbi:MAG: ABC transporter ATP-binding protein [Firmicutes bacterium]|nr:ABC transporter ATP-binding protein [Bacillota bacterium]